MEHTKPDHPLAGVGHELRDTSPRPVLIFAICLLASLAIIQWVAWKSLIFLEQHEDIRNQADYPTQPLSEVMRSNPPDPRLEPEPSHDVLPLADLNEVRAKEQAQIGPDAWHWVDPSHKFARIPLKQAIDLAVQDGLPTVLPTTQPTIQPDTPAASAAHGPGGVP